MFQTNKKDKFTITNQGTISDICNGAIHPVTKETLTNYKKVISCPELHAIWTKGIFKELENISQSYSDGDKINTTI